jgi:serine/threonine-protein kinase
MSSLSGRRIGAFDIGPLIGAGGMGEVYRGRDTKLHRDVAIKVLLAAVASDGERLARFNREAQVLASLNHPNIAHIHGVADGETGPLLILEYVGGPTLADRIASGPIALDEAIAIAKQIADALEAAHERGIVHRDLKPANIKVDDQGTVKVLDFGLAKAIDQGSGIGDQGSASADNSPTITTPAMTQAGLILGTAAYMSPEQAKGRVVDKRTDVWAFGCVLYEMLTGRRAFDGEDVTDTIAAIVRGEPDWTKLPAGTPQRIRLLLKRCVEKDRRTRISDIGVARFLLDETADTVTGAPEVTAGSRSRLAMAVGGALVGAALVAAAWAFMPRPPTPAPMPTRFVLTAPGEAELLPQGNDKDIAIAPDGSFVVYRSGDPATMLSRLMIRSMDEAEPRELPGSEGARGPFVSPDGQFVGFLSGLQLKKVSVAGGGSTVICRVGTVLRGAHWGDDGFIVYTASDNAGVMRVPASGGDPKTFLPQPEGEIFGSPHVLPGGKIVLLAVTNLRSGAGPRIDAIDIATGARQTVLTAGSDPAYVAPGYLLFGVTSNAVEAVARARGSLRMVRFDAVRLETSGDPVTLIEPIAVSPVGALNYSVSRGGDFVYVPGTNLGQSVRRRSLVWVDRQGKETPLPAEQRSYAVARISPDGTRIALDVRDQSNDIWVWDIARQTMSLLSRDPGQDLSPMWTPDSKKIIWGSTRHGGNPNLFSQAADGSGAAERLTTYAGNQFPTSITPDGKTVLLFGAAGQTQMDIFTVRLDGADRAPQPLINTPAFDFDAELSPDGKWIAYHSNDSGEFQVYVRPYPNVNDSRTQISTTGGSRAAWARSGKELFYLDKDGFLTVVPVQPGPVFTAGAPARLFNTKYYAGQSVLGLDLRGYDVTADGQRFLMIKELDTGPAATEAPRMMFVRNGATELRQRLPVP